MRLNANSYWLITRHKHSSCHDHVNIGIRKGCTGTTQCFSTPEVEITLKNKMVRQKEKWNHETMQLKDAVLASWSSCWRDSASLLSLWSWVVLKKLVGPEREVAAWCGDRKSCRCCSSLRSTKGKEEDAGFR